MTGVWRNPDTGQYLSVGSVAHPTARGSTNTEAAGYFGGLNPLLGDGVLDALPPLKPLTPLEPLEPLGGEGQSSMLIMAAIALAMFLW
jgi:hypothetical protein